MKIISKKRLSISHKLAIVLLCCASFTPIVLVGYTSTIEKQSLQEKHKQTVQHRLKAKSQFILNSLELMGRNILFLSQVPVVKIFSSTHFSKKKKDLELYMLDKFSRISTTDVFIDFLKTNPMYLQLAYLDANGMERLRIDQMSDKVVTIDEKNLKNQSQQAYFSEGMQLNQGEIYLSEISLYSLSTTEDHIEATPIIQIATQVYDKKNRLQGVLVANVSTEIFSNVLLQQSNEEGELFFLDSQGGYFAHSNKQKSWNKLLDEQYNFIQEFPELKKFAIEPFNDGIQYHHSINKDIFITPIATSFIQSQPWFIVRVISSKNIADVFHEYLFIILAISFSGILFSLLIGYTFSKIWILTPIKKLMKMSQQISKGFFPTILLKKLPKDEIGDLCIAFNQMSTNLSEVEQEREKHLELLNKEIKERKKIESDLLLHRIFFEQSSDAMFISDNNLRITYVNPAFKDITGYNAEEVIGKDIELLLSDRYDANFYRRIHKKAEEKGSWQGEIWNRRKEKEIFPTLQTINTIKNESEETHYVTVFKDVSRLKDAENELWKLAHFDPLTNLPNRKLLEERIDHALSGANRFKQIGAIIFLDLDNFKHINDSLGHNLGDLVIKQIGERLKDLFRHEDTVARLGGDEYVVLLPNLSADIKIATQRTVEMIKKLYAVLEKPCVVKNHELHVTTSIGVVFFPNDGDTPQKLLKQADTAMYAAKSEGKNTFSFYHSKMQEIADKRLHLERDLRTALKQNELVVYYQPQCNKEHELIGYEALIRWEHPQKGLISPADFIPIAEESDLILEIGAKVLSDACHRLAKAEEVGNDIPHISINISARQFSDLDFIDWVCEPINRIGVDPNRLILEVTEGIIVKNLDRTIMNMQQLKKMGIRFSIDDFGTGYSSLAYLRQLPIDELKIDRSFVIDITDTAQEVIIVDTIVAMAQHMNLKLIAEGVETQKQLDYLVNCGCNGFQGYYFGKPTPGEKIQPLDDELQRVNP